MKRESMPTGRMGTFASNPWRPLLAVVMALSAALAIPAARYANLTIGSVLSPSFWLFSSFVATFTIHFFTLDARSRRLVEGFGFAAELPTLLTILAGKALVLPLGLGFAVVAVGWRTRLLLQAEGEARAAHGRALFDSVVAPYFAVVSPLFLACSGVFAPHPLDLQVQQFGGELGPWPPILVARLFQAVPPIGVASTFVYGMLPVGVALVHALRLRDYPTEPPRLLFSFVAIALFGFPLYFVLPMVGPREAWAALDAHASFPPLAVPSVMVAPLTVDASVPRNCMPSLHTAWALSLFLASRTLSRRMSLFGLAWLVLTELATLGMGEHWLVDLVVAVPFTFAVHSLSFSTRAGTSDWLRRGSLALLTAAWFYVLLAPCDALATRPIWVAIAMMTTVCASVLVAAPWHSRVRVEPLRSNANANREPEFVAQL